MPRVFISDKLHAGGVDKLKSAGLEIDNRQKLQGAELIAAMQAADGMIVRSETKVTPELIENPGKLRAIVRAGVGVDTIDVAAATRKGIVVMNTPGGNTVSTAEQTITLLLALARHVAAADATMRAGRWDRAKFMGVQLAGKTLGVVGLGRIGREVGRRAAGLDMKVLGFDPMLAPDRAADLGIQATADLDTLLPQVDFLTVHTPLTPETQGMIGAKQLARMKKEARVINCARGGIIEEAALVEALTSGHLAGAALDVFAQEPPPPDHPLLKLPNVVLTPHLGASTTEAQESVALEAAQLLIDFLTKGTIQFAVNLAPVDRAELQELRVYVDIGRRLGLLHAQMCQGTIQRAEILYQGDVARRSTKLITSAFTAGLLEGHLAESVNLVNADLLARERGIEINATNSSKKEDFGSLIRVDVTTEKKTYTAAATAYAGQFQRLVQIGNFHLDSSLEGVLLLFSHRDVPGLIGFIGTIFGKHQVNIAQMNVGRKVPGGEAIAVLNLDNKPSEEALKEVRAHPQITSVSVVQLPRAGEMPTWLG